VRNNATKERRPPNKIRLTEISGFFQRDRVVSSVTCRNTDENEERVENEERHQREELTDNNSENGMEVEENEENYEQTGENFTVKTLKHNNGAIL